MLEGSLMAMMSDDPARFTGTTPCFTAVCRGTSLMTSSPISKSFREMDGTPYCLERKLVRSVSAIAPCLMSSDPMRSPVLRCSSWAFWSCCSETRFSRTSSSPRRPDMWLLSPGIERAGRNWTVTPGFREGQETLRRNQLKLYGFFEILPLATSASPEQASRRLHVRRDLRSQCVQRGEAALGANPGHELDPDPLPVEVAPVVSEQVGLEPDRAGLLHRGLHPHVADRVEGTGAAGVGHPVGAQPDPQPGAGGIHSQCRKEPFRPEVRGGEPQAAAAAGASLHQRLHVVGTAEQHARALDVPFQQELPDLGRAD